jgi:hypothetical protein
MHFTSIQFSIDSPLRLTSKPSDITQPESNMVEPGMFVWRFGGPALPEYDLTTQPCTYFATVFFTMDSKSWDSEALMEVMVESIRNGHAIITKKPLHSAHTLCISIPIYGISNAPGPVVIASALPVAERYLREIQQGFIEIHKERLFRESKSDHYTVR